MRACNRLFFSSILLLVCATGHAWAFGNEKIIRSVNVGSSLIIRNFLIYNLNPCRSMPTPSFDAGSPNLGRISSEVVELKLERGPCEPGFKYHALRITYHSGQSAGIDNFSIYVHDGYRFTPIPIEIRVAGRSSQSSAKSKASKEKPSVASVPASKQSEAKKNEPKSEIYVNNIGNTVEIINDIIYFSGYWNKEKVSKKAFAIVVKGQNEFEWGVYKCLKSAGSFECSNTKRDQTVLYRKIQ